MWIMWPPASVPRSGSAQCLDEIDESAVVDWTDWTAAVLARRKSTDLLQIYARHWPPSL